MQSSRICKDPPWRGWNAATGIAPCQQRHHAMSTVCSTARASDVSRWCQGCWDVTLPLSLRLLAQQNPPSTISNLLTPHRLLHLRPSCRQATMATLLRKPFVSRPVLACKQNTDGFCIFTKGKKKQIFAVAAVLCFVPRSPSVSFPEVQHLGECP